MTDIQNIIIDEEFKSLLPALDKSTYAALEENILQYGCRDPLILWNGFLIDGHNRFEICREHNIAFNTVNMEFESRDRVLIWIIATQISRRNMNHFQLAYCRGMHYHADKRIWGDIDRFAKEPPSGHSDHMDGSTATRLARQYNVSPKTIRRDAQLADAITAIGRSSPDAKRDVLAAKTSISMKKLRELSSEPEEEVASVAARIEEGTYEKSKPDPDEAPLLEKEYKKASDGFYREVSNYTKSGDAGAMRMAFRAYLDTLEEMFGCI